jgi:cytidylate kinase
MKTVTITLSGPAKSGKKAVAELLNAVLTAARFNVSMDESPYAESTLDEVAETVKRLSRANTEVVIKFEKA